MVKAKIYIEGGGSGKLADTIFRQGWHEFFKSAGLTGHMPETVRGRGRERTFDLFKTAVRNPKAGLLPLLLVDSEDPVEPGHSVWRHLKTRDGWSKPRGTTDDQAFLMVQIMETWFLADRESLRSYFGKDFNEKPIKAWPRLEDVGKPAVIEALEQATARCNKPYAKGRTSFQLLAEVNAKAAEEACPHARVFLDRLRAL